jgi:predicted lipid-binding transport protein (Tim44 family)
MRTFSAPPATPTAPTAAPIERSITQPGNVAPNGQTGIRPGLFGGGLFGGLAAGFLGAGLFGLLFGHGLFGGMAGFASMIGLLLQVVLVVIVARLIFAWWQRRNMQPAYAAAHPVTGHNFGGVSEMLGGANLSPAGEHLAIAKSDYDAFERSLGEIPGRLFNGRPFDPTRKGHARNAVLFLRAVGGQCKSRTDQSCH